MTERQQDHYNQKNNVEDTSTLKNNWYESKYDGHVCIDDKETRSALSTYTYVIFWSKTLCAMKRYQHRQYKIQQRYFVRSLFEEQNADNTIKFPLHGRYNYQHIKYFDRQCEHELSVNTKFDVTRQNKRRLNNHTFQQTYPHLQPFHNIQVFLQNSRHKVHSLVNIYEGTNNFFDGEDNDIYALGPGTNDNVAYASIDSNKSICHCGNMHTLLYALS